MHTFRCAYRFASDRVEGFTGFGFGEYSARKDCREQIRRRLSAIAGESPTVVESNVIYFDDDLTSEEMEQVRRDWAKGLRYGPDGSPYPD
jgi:hypothetical protein